jgi:pimeloyl-ACP methyl ester carboxylesterase
MAEIMNISNTKVYIEGENNEEVIIMIHGWPDIHTIWKNQVEYFKSSDKCVTFTFPGFRKGDIKQYRFDDIILEINHIVNAVSPNKKVILMLHDWGCAFGYEYAMRYANKIDRMIGIDIGDATSKEYMGNLPLKTKLMTAGYQLPNVLGWKLSGKIGDSLIKKIAKGVHARSDMDEIHSGMSYLYAMAWLGANGGMKRFKPLEPQFPFYYAYGTRKPFLFHTEEWVNKIKANSINSIESFSSGHWVMVDKAEEFNQSVENWLTKE